MTSFQIDRLFKQIVWSKFPRIKITENEKFICNAYQRPMEPTCHVKVETYEVNQFTVSSELSNASRISESDQCTLCLRRRQLVYDIFPDLGKGNNLDRENICHAIFEKGMSTEELNLDSIKFCGQCHQAIVYLQHCYSKLAEIQREYSECLLRIRCFRRHARQATTEGFIDSESTSHECCDADNFECDSDCHSLNEPFGINSLVKSVKNEDVIEVKDTEDIIHVEQLVECLPKSSKSVKGHRQVPEKQFIAHRCAENPEYNHPKKTKLEISSKQRKVCLGQNDVLEGNKSECRATEDSSTAKSIYEDTSPAASSKRFVPICERQLESSSNSKPTKKYDYKCQTIRRRGGLTEEEYQEHRRAQSARYYFEKKRRLGILKFGPKPLSAAKMAKLERQAQACLDPSELPAKSGYFQHVKVSVLEEGKRFSYRNTEFTKDEDGNHKCSSCGHTARVLNVMKRHIAKHHFDKNFGYKCETCDKSFYYKCQLQNHEGTHLEKGRIQCEHCGQSFKFYSGYFTHKRVVHEGYRPHECVLCSKSFASKKDLRKHNESKSHLEKSTLKDFQ